MKVGLLMNDYSELLESISKNTGNPHDAFINSINGLIKQ